ncbi:hypothetical protein [Demequina pelophila]|uniref:hypothetical protein n=1 Tax=Demequina pelophila TaxID=1638984 RepID=UPI0009E547B9
MHAIGVGWSRCRSGLHRRRRRLVGLLCLADHPTTGGYPVVALVRLGSLQALGQARPGGAVRLVGPAG